jgi:hypothetical protein
MGKYGLYREFVILFVVVEDTLRSSPVRLAFKEV